MVLRNIAVNVENIPKIVAAGAIPPLVSLLSAHNSGGVQAAAAEALCNLAIDDDNWVKITDAGAIPPLVVMLGAQNTAAVQEAAAKILSIFAKDANNQVAAAGAIPLLVALLGSQSPATVLEPAAGALVNITRNDAGNRISVAAAGAIPSLVALLGTHSSVSVQEVAARAVGNIALNVDNQAAIKSDPCALSLGFSLAKLHSTSPSALVRQAAEWALLVLSCAPEDLVAAEEDKVAAKAAAANNLKLVGETSMTAAKSSSMSASSTEAGPSQQTDPSQQARPSALAPASAVSCASAPASSVAAASPSSSAAASHQLLPPRPRKSCWWCGAAGVPLKKCSVCAVAAYCGAGCQKMDWKAHKGQCAGLKAGASKSGSSVAVSVGETCALVLGGQGRG